MKGNKENILHQNFKSCYKDVQNGKIIYRVRAPNTIKNVKAIFKKKSFSKKYNQEVLYFFRLRSYNPPYGPTYGTVKNHTFYEAGLLPIIILVMFAPLAVFIIRITIGPFFGIIINILLMFYLTYLFTASMIFIPIFRKYFIDKCSKTWKDRNS